MGADAWRHAKVLLALPPSHALQRAWDDALPEWPGVPGIPRFPSLAGMLAFPVSSPIHKQAWLPVVICRLKMHAASQLVSYLFVRVRTFPSPQR